MNDDDPTSPNKTLPSRSVSSATLGAIAAVALISGVTGLFAGCSSSSPTDTTPLATDAAGPTTDASSSTADADADAGSSANDGASNVRSPPSEGGASGTVDNVSSPTFTMTTGAGQTVTVNETSSTTYSDGTNPTSASAITSGKNVLVLGIVNSTTIIASQVILLPSNIDEAAASAAAGVIPFQQGVPSSSKTVGQIPDYTEGEGTIVSGTTADQSTENALAAYPGVLVDRVVLLSGGEYEVHCIGVNWPHHIFVDQSLQVTGAN
jgi:hypothetical protein